MPPKRKGGQQRPKRGGETKGDDNPARTSEDHSDEEVEKSTSNMTPTTGANRNPDGQQEEGGELGRKSPEPETQPQVTSSVNVTDELKKELYELRARLATVELSRSKHNTSESSGSRRRTRRTCGC